MIRSWRAVWSGDSQNALFGIATLAAGGSEGSGWHISGMAAGGNYGVWPNPAMPNCFGAQLYDWGDPWANVGDGNPRNSPLNLSKNGGLNCCFGSTDVCPTLSSARGTHYTPCPDKFNCSLPEPKTGQFGSECEAWDTASWLPSLTTIGPLIRQNAPSGLAGNNFMGGIHPRLKRPVGRRLAYAAVQMMKQQRSVLGPAAGALSGPTISGCELEHGELNVHFNASLLGGEALLLRDENSISNASDWAQAPGWSGIDTIHDSSGLMLCTVNLSAPETGNATTCACSGWNYYEPNEPKSNPGAFWYCETGPGWKPPLQTVLKEKRTRHARAMQRQARIMANKGALATVLVQHELGWVPQANKFQLQWQPARFLPGNNGSSAKVDLTHLNGLTPVAMRLGWPLFDAPYQVADTCCPSAAAQSGKSACVPGGCPLYSNMSELPANPFFATINDGKCRCLVPQICNDSSL